MAVEVRMYQGDDGKLYHTAADAEYADTRAMLFDGFVKGRGKDFERGMTQLLNSMLKDDELCAALGDYLDAVRALPETVPPPGQPSVRVAEPALALEVVAPMRRRAIRTGDEPEEPQPQPRPMDEEQDKAWGDCEVQGEPEPEPDTVRTQRRRSSSDARGFDSDGIGPLGRALRRF